MKLLAVDMDGTLLLPNGSVSRESVRAIKEFQSMGGKVLVCTGRSFQDAVLPVRQAGILCDFICMNGAAFYHMDGRMEAKKTISFGRMKRILELAEQYGLATDLMAVDRSYTTMKKEEFIKNFSDGILLPMVNLDLESMWGRFQMISSQEILEQKMDIFKVSVLHKSRIVLERIWRILEEEGGLALASSDVTNIEITSNQAQKGLALMEYARKHQILPEEIIAIGDSGNDVSMLSLPLGVTVAMGNAMPEAVESAMYQTKTNAEDGVAYALDTWVVKRIFAIRFATCS